MNTTQTSPDYNTTVANEQVSQPNDDNDKKTIMVVVIAGCSAAMFLLILLVILLAVVLSRRRKQRKRNNFDEREAASAYSYTRELPAFNETNTQSKPKKTKKKIPNSDRGGPFDNMDMQFDNVMPYQFEDEDAAQNNPDKSRKRSKKHKKKTTDQKKHKDKIERDDQLSSEKTDNISDLYAKPNKRVMKRSPHHKADIPSTPLSDPTYSYSNEIDTELPEDQAETDFYGLGGNNPYPTEFNWAQSQR